MRRRRNAEEVQRHPAAPGELQAPRVGWVAGNVGSVVLVDFQGNNRGPVAARSTVRLSTAELRSAVEARQGVVLLFEDGDPGRPLLVGLVQTASDTPLLDEVLRAPLAPEEARVDGKRVVIEGKDEIVLRCGQSSITLRRNGRVTIKGVQLETRARGLQRIRGGKVEIN